jgi:hypothetical protein
LEIPPSGPDFEERVTIAVLPKSRRGRGRSINV